MNSIKDIGDTITNDMVNDTGAKNGFVIFNVPVEIYEPSTSPSTTLLSTVNLKHIGMKHNDPKRNGTSFHKLVNHNISVPEKDHDFIFCGTTCLGESPQKHLILQHP